MPLKLTKAELKEAIATLYAHLCDGKTDKDTMEIMGLSADDYEALRSAMFEAKAEELRSKPAEHVYVEYTIKQAENLKDLTKMVGEFYVSKQYNAMVGAVRARAEIYDKLLKTGQEFGVLKTNKAEAQLVAGLMVANLTNEELKKAVLDELRALNVMMRTYGDKKIVDMPVGSLHYGPSVEDDEAALDAKALPPPASTPLTPSMTASRPMPDKPPAKHAKASTAKVSGGRRVVKEKVKAV